MKVLRTVRFFEYQKTNSPHSYLYIMEQKNYTNPKSFWIKTTEETNFPTLHGEMEADVAIIGGGIAGLASAYMLKKEGKTVVVLEADKIAADVTGHTTAHISYGHNLIYQELIKNFDPEIVKLYIEANKTALEKIAEMVEKYNIECDFSRVPQYMFAETEEELAKLQEEFKVLKELGVTEVVREDSVPLPFKTLGAIKYSNQAQFHPRKFLLAIAGQMFGKGVLIYENSRVAEVEDKGDYYEIETSEGKVKAKDVIVATHYPILDRGLYFPRMTIDRTYVIGVRTDEEITEHLFEASDEPPHSIRTERDEKGQVVFVLGSDHPVGTVTDTANCYRKLEEYACERFSVASVDYYWSAQDNYTFDKLPFIGRYMPGKDHLYVATGFNGWGMTHGFVAGMLLSDLIMGRDNPWEKVYTPSRVNLTVGGTDLFKKNLEVGKHFVEGRMADRPEGVENLEIGEGKIVEIDGEEVAAYRDSSNKVHKVSPKCTHMGCHVAWNNSEKSWDCPCHGSRFNYEGEVIHGPAVKNLNY